MLLTVTLNPAIDLYVELQGWQFGGEVNRARSARRVLGGKGINVSRVAKTLGAETRAMMLAGEDTGPVLARLISREPFPIETIPAPGETRTNIHILNRENGDSLKVNQSGAPVRAALDDLKTKFAGALSAAQIIVLSGSLPPECPVEIYGELCELAREVDTPVVLDCEGAALLEGLAGHPAIVKPNRRELAETLGRSLPTQADVAAAARELQHMGAASVIVTDGDRPTLAFFGEDTWRVTPPEIESVHPTGAGDAFTGALAAGLQWDWSLEETLRLASAAGAAACLGEDVDLEKEIQALLPKVSVERL